MRQLLGSPRAGDPDILGFTAVAFAEAEPTAAKTTCSAVMPFS